MWQLLQAHRALHSSELWDIAARKAQGRKTHGRKTQGRKTLGNTIGNTIGNTKDVDTSIFINSQYFLRGSGGLLGPSWTFPDTFWTIMLFKIFLAKVVPKDLLRDPRHIPDDPNKLQHHVIVFGNVDNINEYMYKQYM